MSEINYIKGLREGTSPINLKIIGEYQQKYPRLMAKYKTGKYKSRYFCGVINRNFNLIACNNRIVIPSTLQKYALN